MTGTVINPQCWRSVTSDPSSFFLEIPDAGVVAVFVRKLSWRNELQAWLGSLVSDYWPLRLALKVLCPFRPMDCYAPLLWSC